MESVKVDVQKLQLLNERLVQTLEALNQVRMSMHGSQPTQQAPYTQAPYTQAPFTPFAYPTPYGFQQGYPVGYAPFIPGYGPAFGTPFVQGIQHTTATTPTWPMSTQTAPWMPWQTQTPWTQQQWTQTPWTQQPWMQPQWPQTPTQTWGNGISHTPHMTTGPLTWCW